MRGIGISCWTHFCFWLLRSARPALSSPSCAPPTDTDHGAANLVSVFFPVDSDEMIAKKGKQEIYIGDIFQHKPFFQ